MIISQSNQRTEEILDDEDKTKINRLIPSPLAETSGQRQIGHSQSLPDECLKIFLPSPPIPSH